MSFDLFFEAATEHTPSDYQRRLACGERNGHPVMAIYRHAISGDGREASRLASRRLRASDMPPAIAEVALSGDTVRRTAAALLFAIAPNDFELMQKVTLRNGPPTLADSRSLANAMTSLP